MIEQRPPQSDFEDVRLKATKTIWALSVAMLGICVPLMETIRSPIIPIFVLTAAAVSTMRIWGSKSGASRSLGSDSAALDAASKKQIQELEERLAALESITNFEHHLLEKKYPNAAPVPMAPVAMAPVAVAPVAPTFSLETAPGGVMSDAGSAVSPSSAAQRFPQSG